MTLSKCSSFSLFQKFFVQYFASASLREVLFVSPSVGFFLRPSSYFPSLLPHHPSFLFTLLPGFLHTFASSSFPSHLSPFHLIFLLPIFLFSCSSSSFLDAPPHFHEKVCPSVHPQRLLSNAILGLSDAEYSNLFFSFFFPSHLCPFLVIFILSF